jgi:hypothetical protein
MKSLAVTIFMVLALANGQRIANFNQTGAAFVRDFYALFDTPQRSGVRVFYDTDSVLVTGGDIYYGVDSIIQKFTAMIAVLQRTIYTMDSQPTKDAGVIVNVAGRIAFNDTTRIVTPSPNMTLWFNEMFVLKPRVTALYIENHHFRSGVWNMTTSSMNNSDSLIFV